jgi:hypothetical protein
VLKVRQPSARSPELRVLHFQHQKTTPEVEAEPRTTRLRISFMAPKIYPSSRRTGRAFVGDKAIFASAISALTPNPSFNHRTRYGGLSWPDLGYPVHSPSPGQAIPPHRAG